MEYNNNPISVPECFNKQLATHDIARVDEESLITLKSKPYDGEMMREFELGDNPISFLEFVKQGEELVLILRVSASRFIPNISNNVW